MNEALKLHLEDVIGKFLQLFPPERREKVRADIYIAGGAIVSYLIKQPIVDYDFFIKTPEACESIRNYLRELGDNLAVTQNAVTRLLPTGEKLQVVTRFSGPPSRVFESFDFEHCKAYYDPATGELSYKEDIIGKMALVYTGIDNYPLNTLKRLVKFTKRGWNIDNESILALAMKLHTTNLSDPEVLREQKIGFYGSPLS